MPQTAKNDDAKFRIPEGRRPEEFLRDADLAEFYRRRLAKAKKTDPDYAQVAADARRAERAAALTATVDPDATAETGEED
jgi:hypothetical protein